MQAAAFERDGDRDVGGAMAQQPLFRPGGVGRRHGLQRHGQRFDDEIVERELEGARSFLWGKRVEPRAGGERRIELAIDGEIEMRDGLLRQREPLGDEAPHGVVRDDLI